MAGITDLLRIKSNFLSFNSFDSVHVRLSPETVPKGTTVIQTLTKAENPPGWLGSI